KVAGTGLTCCFEQAETTAKVFCNAADEARCADCEKRNRSIKFLGRASLVVTKRFTVLAMLQFSPSLCDTGILRVSDCFRHGHIDDPAAVGGANSGGT